MRTLPVLVLLLAAATAPAAPRAPAPPVWLPGSGPRVATLVEPLRDGPLSFARRIALIEGARASLIGTSYAIDHDRYGERFLDALIHAARRGVKVAIGLDRTAQLVYDLRAPRAARALRWRKLAELERAGGTVAWYGGIRVHLRRPAAGIHFKALVADGREAVMDGRNVGHEYVERWTDFGLRLRGPIVDAIAEETLRLLGRCLPYRGLRALGQHRARRTAYGQLLDGLARELAHPRLRRDAAGRSAPRFTLVAWDPLGDERTFWPRAGANRITAALARAVRGARREVTLSSNFVHAGRPLREALCEAARRGVRVRIVTTGEVASEVSKLPYWITRAHYRALVEAGCEVYETTRMEHAKLFLFDGALGAFGSYNASKISDTRNAEGLLFTRDPATLRAIRSALDEDLARSLRFRARAPRGVTERLRAALEWPLRLITR